jgi:hypothetical protein
LRIDVYRLSVIDHYSSSLVPYGFAASVTLVQLLFSYVHVNVIVGAYEGVFCESKRLVCECVREKSDDMKTNIQIAKINTTPKGRKLPFEKEWQ